MGGEGISIQLSCTKDGACDPTARSLATVRGPLVDHTHQVGLIVWSSDATVESTVVRATSQRAADGLFGEGVGVVSYLAASTASLATLLVDESARAGVASFGADVSLRRTQIRCAAFALNGESYGDRDFALEDGGENACGCPSADGPCKTLSAGIAPPEPPDFK